MIAAPLIQGNVVPIKRAESQGSGGSRPGSIRSAQQMDPGSPSLVKVNPWGNLYSGAPLPLVGARTVAPSQQGSGERSYPLIGQAPQASTAPSLAPRVVLPSREVTIGTHAPMAPSTVTSVASTSPTIMTLPNMMQPTVGTAQDGSYFFGTTVAAPSSSPYLTSSGALHPAGQMAAAQLAAPSNITHLPPATFSLAPPGSALAMADDAQIRALFETSDSNHDGVLEWNTGEVEAFGKAVLEKFGRETGSQTLLYNTFDDVDKNFDAKMDITEAVEFARRVLLKSNAAPPPKPQAKSLGGNASQPRFISGGNIIQSEQQVSPSIFDTGKSTMTSPWDTNVSNPQVYAADVSRLLSGGDSDPMIDTQGAFSDRGGVNIVPQSAPSVPSDQELVDSAMAAQNQALAAQQQALADEVRRLEVENNRFLRENRMLEQQLQELRNAQQIQPSEQDLMLMQQENARLRSKAAELEQALRAKQSEPVQSFDPIMNDKVRELEETNQQLMRLLNEAQSNQGVDAATQELNKALQEAYDENDQLNKRLADLQASQSMGGSMGQQMGGPIEDDQTRLIKEDLENRERTMEAEIQQLTADRNAALEKTRELETRLGEAPEEPSKKKKKFICC